MSIAKQLFAFVVIAVLILCSSLAVSIIQGVRQQQKLVYIGNVVIPSMRYLGDVSVQIGEYRRLITSFNRVVGTPEEASLHVVADMEKAANNVDKAFDSYASVVDGEEDHRLLKKNATNGILLLPPDVLLFLWHKNMNRPCWKCSARLPVLPGLPI